MVAYDVYYPNKDLETDWKQPGNDFYKTKGGLSFPYTIQSAVDQCSMLKYMMLIYDNVVRK